MNSTTQPLLRVDNLSVSFGQGEKAIAAVHEVSFAIKKGETLALVGESGSGKSVTALSILRLLAPSAHHPSGRICFDGSDILTMPPAPLQGLRGGRIGMVFQEPMTSLNPLHSINKQITETLKLHKKWQGQKKPAIRARVIELLTLVGLPSPEQRLNALPHELSGGQRQRVMIAMALANDPALLIADEPTTALDVTIQAQIINLLRDLQTRLGMAILFITHDLGIVHKLADRVCVMQQGKIVETATTQTLFSAPQHSYTKTLLASQPTAATKRSADPPVILSADNVKVWFPLKGGVLNRTIGHVKAVDGISLKLRQGRTLGVVGESGSGKSTLGLALLRLIHSQGNMVFDGQPISDKKFNGLRALRKSMQIVFQDPYGALSPRLSVGGIIGEGLDIHMPRLTNEERHEHIAQALISVDLDPAMQDRYPHEFSGGQRQRIAIARALILSPKLLILDEPTSALDVSVQVQIVDLLREIQERLNISYIFISHDLKVIRALADDIIVMQNGRVVESGAAEKIMENPAHPYTQALMNASLPK